MAIIDPRLKSLAQHLDRFVRTSGLTRAEISRSLGVDDPAVTRWLNGGRTPTLKNLMDLAELLGVEMADLWSGGSAMPATPEQQAMLQKMAQMTPEQQQALLALAATMAPTKTP